MPPRLEDLFLDPGQQPPAPEAPVDNFSDPQLEDYLRQTLKPRSEIIKDLQREYTQALYGNKPGKTRKILGGIFEGITAPFGGARSGYAEQRLPDMMKAAQSAAQIKVGDLKADRVMESARGAQKQRDDAVALTQQTLADKVKLQEDTKRTKIENDRVGKLVDQELKRMSEGNKGNLQDAMAEYWRVKAAMEPWSNDPKTRFSLSNMNEEEGKKFVAAAVDMARAKGQGRGSSGGAGGTTIHPPQQFKYFNPSTNSMELMSGPERKTIRIPNNPQGNQPQMQGLFSGANPLNQQAPTTGPTLPGPGVRPQPTQSGGINLQSQMQALKSGAMDQKGPGAITAFPPGAANNPLDSTRVRDREQAFQGVEDMGRKVATMWKEGTLQNFTGLWNNLGGLAPELSAKWRANVSRKTADGKPVDPTVAAEADFKSAVEQENYQYLVSQSGKQFSHQELNIVRGFLPQKTDEPKLLLYRALQVSLLFKARAARERLGYTVQNDQSVARKNTDLDFSGAATKAAKRLAAEIVAGRAPENSDFDPMKIPEFQEEWAKVGVKGGVVGSQPGGQPITGADYLRLRMGK